jgi:hypothetical protein
MKGIVQYSRIVVATGELPACWQGRGADFPMKPDKKCTLR